VRLMRGQGGLFDYRRLGYSLPLAANGLRFAAAHSDVEYRVGGDFEALGIRGKVRSSELGVTYPWLRGRTRNVVVSAGQRRVETEQSALGVEVSRTSLALATASVNASWVHRDSSASTLSLGFSGNGKDNIGPVAKPDALRARYDLDYTYLTGISPRWDMFLRGQVVQTAGMAPDTEKFGLGGPDSVRAYRSAELRGDQGWLIAAELRRQFSLADTVAVASVFYDWGGVQNKGFAGQDKLQGVGAGVTVYPARNVRAQLQIATPFQSRTPADGKGARAWFTLSVQF
jgi:hemolysin activation/secretion protein